MAGGASSRMGCDKAQLRLGGKTFIEKSVVALSAVATENITLVGEINQHPLEIKFLNLTGQKLRVINDLILEKQSSGTNRPRAAIIGLYTALINAEKEWLVVLACDLPFVSGKLLKRLVFLLQNSQAETNSYDAVVPIQSDGKMQPLCALYRRAACLNVAEEMLAGKDWSLQNLLQRVKTYFVSFDKIADLQNSEHFFFNTNTPEDFSKAQEIERIKKD